jgi:hypothetical protein
VVLEEILAYMMSVFPAPKGILQKIRAIQIDFLWRGVKNKKKWALVAWEKVFRPKGKGGLGLQDPQVTNEAGGDGSRTNQYHGQTFGRPSMPRTSNIKTEFESWAQGRGQPSVIWIL